MTRYLSLLVALVLAGCAPNALNVSPFAAGMSPEQLKEMVKDKSAGVTCVAGTYAGARVVIVTATEDKGVPTFMEIGDDCKVKIGPPPPVPR